MTGGVIGAGIGRFVWFPPLFAFPFPNRPGPAGISFFTIRLVMLGSLIFNCSLKAKQKSPILKISPFFPEYRVRQFLQKFA